jgi:hypothetical protein
VPERPVVWRCTTGDAPLERLTPYESWSYGNVISLYQIPAAPSAAALRKNVYRIAREMVLCHRGSFYSSNASAGSGRTVEFSSWGLTPFHL